MPSIREDIASRSIKFDFENTTAELLFHITDTDDESVALGLLAAAAPVTWTVDGFILSKLVFDVKPDGYKVWRGTVAYSKRLAVSESSYQFETGGGSTHITHSLQTMQVQPAAGWSAPNFYNAIGWDGKQINGCDIVSPVYNFSETHVLAAASVTAAYKLALFRATGKFNNATFKGFAAGEALFLGASGTKRADADEWEINYRFAASENVTGLAVGGITGINKRGWDYLWLSFADDTSANILIKRPVVAIVEQVYYSHDFSNIGIGT